MNDFLALTIAVCDTYKTDPSSPSVITSFLPDGRWYLSIQRYAEPFGKGKIIVCKTTGSTFDKAFKNLCVLWQNHVESLTAALAEGK